MKRPREGELSMLLTTKELAKYLKLRPETVLRKVKSGKIPGLKVGGQFRFDREQIDEWLSNKVTLKKRILVVDDDKVIRELFRETLEAGGYQVMTAQDGNEALKLVKKWTFDLIFTDLKMPGMDGAETFRQVRQIDISVPIVIITGYALSTLMEKVLEQGPFGVMRKPFDVLDIQRSADSFLRGIGARERLAQSFKQLGYNT